VNHEGRTSDLDWSIGRSDNGALSLRQFNSISDYIGRTRTKSPDTFIAQLCSMIILPTYQSDQSDSPILETTFRSMVLVQIGPTTNARIISTMSYG
jgi:hypothetical protein